MSSDEYASSLVALRGSVLADALAAIVVDEAVRLNRFRISRNRFHRCRWVLLGSLDHFFHRVSHNRLALSFLHAYEHTRIQAWFGLSFPAAGW